MSSKLRWQIPHYSCSRCCLDLQQWNLENWLMSWLRCLQHPFSRDTKMAGRDWLTSFLRRHKEISLRDPEPTSIARAVGFNKPSVDRFFSVGLCKQELEKENFTAQQVIVSYACCFKVRILLITVLFLPYCSVGVRRARYGPLTPTLGQDAHYSSFCFLCCFIRLFRSISPTCCCVQAFTYAYLLVPVYQSCVNRIKFCSTNKLKWASCPPSSRCEKCECLKDNSVMLSEIMCRCWLMGREFCVLLTLS